MKSGFGNAGKPPASAAKPRSKPLKRPSQARAVFTVEAIYEAFVRIWLRQGWDALTTRAVALEAGVAIGTLYDYFPNKEALLSGYVRHGIERLVDRLDTEVAHVPGLSWQERVERLLTLSCSPHASGQTIFGYDMIQLEHLVAERKHHQRAFTELSGAWQAVFAACTDLPRQPSAATVEAWLNTVWGGYRYSLTAQLSPAQAQAWLAEVKAMLLLRIDGLALPD